MPDDPRHQSTGWDRLQSDILTALRTWDHPSDTDNIREAAAREIERLQRCMNPRRWTPEMDRAWHRAIPDVAAAFIAVEKASRAR